jgi:hypothetical protein
MAMIKGVHEALALRTTLLEMDIESTIEIFTDSSAAKCSAEKPGLMHMRHMQLRELFLKQIVQQGMVIITKLGTEENPADMLTKAVNRRVLEKFWLLMKDQLQRDFEREVKEIQLVEVDDTEREDNFPWRLVGALALLAISGTVWITEKLKSLWDMIFVREGVHRVGLGVPRSKRASELRSVGCMSMSSWLYGRQGRFVPTRDCDQGAFVNGMAINENRSVDASSRDICA